MKRKIYISIAAVMLAVNFAYGQDSETARQDRQLDRQVDVSRDYAPDVEAATKLTIVPNMIDTTLLRPQFDYSVKTTAWTTGFGVTAINPVNIDASLYNPIYPFYLKMGVGVPIQSTLDFYAASRGKKGTIGGYVNHDGRYGKIKNDFGRRTNATQTTNSGAVFGSVNIGRRMSLDGEAGMDYNLWSLYGYGPEATSQAAGSDIERQRYLTLHSKLSFGNDFKDLSYFNFRVGGYADLMAGREVGDDDGNNEDGLGLFAEIGKQFSVHQFKLKLSYDHLSLSRSALIGGGSGSRDFNNNVLTVAPKYGVETKRFKLTIGADFAYNVRQYVDNKLYVLPQASINFDVTSGWLVPYVTLDSRLVNNGWRSMVDINPYVDLQTDIPLKPTREYNLRGGIHGAISSSFAYRVYVGWSRYNDPVYLFKAYDDEPEFDMTTDSRLNKYLVGMELDGRISSSFTAGLSAHLYKYSASGLDHAVNLPNAEASLYVKYNYRDKFSLKLGATLIGKRYFMSYDAAATVTDYLYTRQKPVVDITLEAEYRVKRGFAVFLTGENLGNSKLYRFQHYRDQGIGVIAGIKLVF